MNSRKPFCMIHFSFFFFLSLSLHIHQRWCGGLAHGVGLTLTLVHSTDRTAVWSLVLTNQPVIHSALQFLAYSFVPPSDSTLSTVRSVPRPPSGNKKENPAECTLKDEEDTIPDYNYPVYFWLLSTFFPFTEWNFGPMASGMTPLACIISLSILRYPSFQYPSPCDILEKYDLPCFIESEGMHIPNPTWLLAVNGISLAIANHCQFVERFIERKRTEYGSF